MERLKGARELTLKRLYKLVLRKALGNFLAGQRGVAVGGLVGGHRQADILCVNAHAWRERFRMDLISFNSFLSLSNWTSSSWWRTGAPRGRASCS